MAAWGGSRPDLIFSFADRCIRTLKRLMTLLSSSTLKKMTLLMLMKPTGPHLVDVLFGLTSQEGPARRRSEKQHRSDSSKSHNHPVSTVVHLFAGAKGANVC